MTLAELVLVFALFLLLLRGLRPLRRRVEAMVARLFRQPAARVIRGNFNNHEDKN